MQINKFNFNNVKRITKNLGFTLIELLVVVAIVGLLVSIISASFTSARRKTRDTKRITDMKQIKTGLDLYYANGSGYPDTATWTANIGASLQCSGTPVLQVPRDPIPNSYQYTYTASGSSISGCGTTVRSAYTIQFYIEKQGAYYTMDQDGTVRDAGGTAVAFDSLL